MSDVTVTPEQAPINIDPSAAPKPNPAPVAASSNDERDPAWVAQRLERERQKWLKDLGVESVDSVKKAIESAKAQDEAKKSDAQKLAELEASLKNVRASDEAKTKALGEYAAAQMKQLSDAQRAAVQAVAGDDPAQQLKSIEALRPTWASAAAPAASTQEQKPADTGHTRSAPKGTDGNSPPDLKAIYDEYKDRNPVWAARFALANGLFDSNK